MVTGGCEQPVNGQATIPIARGVILLHAPREGCFLLMGYATRQTGLTGTERYLTQALQMQPLQTWEAVHLPIFDGPERHIFAT